MSYKIFLKFYKYLKIIAEFKENSNQLKINCEKQNV